MMIMIRILFLGWISTRHAQSQVSWIIGTSVPRFKEELKLTCTVSSGCCSSSSRIWKDGAGVVISTNGNSDFPNKYAEDWDISNTTSFSLIIKNLQLSDVEKIYVCQYSIGTDSHTLTQDGKWEYAPEEKCPATIGFMEGLLISDLHVGRSAPKPTFYASNRVNLTSLLTEKDVRTFDNWFFSLTVNLKKKVTCGNKDRFILEAVTGTKTTKICDSVDLCACLQCFYICMAICLLSQFIGSVICVAFLFKQGQLSCKEGCLMICLRMVMAYFLLTTLFNVLPSYSFGWYDCPCKITWTWFFIVFLTCATGPVASWIILCQIYDWIYLWDIFSKKSPFQKFGICCLGIISCGIAFFIFSAYDKNWFRGTGSKKDPYKVYVKQGFEAVLECKDKDGKKKWNKKDDNEWKAIADKADQYNILDKPACCKNMYHRLHIMDSQPIDEGTYRCVGEADKEYHFQLILRDDDASYFKRWIYFGMIMVSTLIIIPVIVLIICFKCLKGGKNQSVESGSSCWPICRVGQDPNTSSSGPESVRRSPKKERADKKPTDFARSPENERADKKKERKPTEVVRPQPTRPLPPMHLKTDNTGRAEYSTETEIFKPPALPSINKASDSPRPLPQKPPGTQLDPLSDSTSDKKKKKKRKKKEPKQSDEEN